MDLTSESGAQLRFTGMGWDFFLNLAKRYGWVAEPTLAPEGHPPEPWSGTYDSNEGQTVTREGAKALAAALQRALDDPNRKHQEMDLAASMSDVLSSHFGKPVPVEAPDDDGRLLREFAVFCGKGSFTIE